MILEDILSKVDHLAVHGPRDAVVAEVSNDSRRIVPGALFVAIPGCAIDGVEFVGRAVEAGARVVFVESSSNLGSPLRGATSVIVENARRALAQVADVFYGEPSAQLDVLGVTGTNGKTSVTFMARDLLRGAGRSPGLLGTVKYETGRRSLAAVRTTPDAVQLQRLLAEMVRDECDSVALEVSSHALIQERVTNVRFDVGVFTNLTAEHLDYHHDMDGYAEAKAQLFFNQAGGCSPSTAVIGRDNPWGEKLLERMPSDMEVLSFGESGDADIRADAVVTGGDGSRFTCHTPWGTRDVFVGLVGRYNVLNALAALGACGAMGVDLDSMVASLARLEPVPGRLEEVPNPGGAKVFIDYAHTHDALASVLASLRELPHRSLWVLFGCGGDRDKAKRPLMGEVASKLADHVVLTTDNPRTEAPESIISDVRKGIPASADCVVEIDRRAAIASVLRKASAEDIVLIAGKGHETYQDFGNTVVPFDDRQVAREISDGERGQHCDT